MNGLHHSREAAAEVVGGVGPDLWGLLQDNDLGGAVEEPGQELAQLHLQLRCQGGEREESAAPRQGETRWWRGAGLRGRARSSCDAFEGVIPTAGSVG